MTNGSRLPILMGTIGLIVLGTVAQACGQATPPPKIFLNKSPRVVAYQLKRLSNARLLRVERNTADAKYVPVYRAILTRSGMSPDEQAKAAQALAELNRTSLVTEFLGATSEIKSTSRQDRLTARQIIQLLVRTPQQLDGQTVALSDAATSEGIWSRQAGFAGLIASGKTDQALSAAKSDEQIQACLAAIELVPQPERRNSLRESILAWLSHDNVEVQRAAILALQGISKDRKSVYSVLAPKVVQSELREAVVETLLTIQKDDRNAKQSANVVDFLVKLAEDTPAADRTSSAFTSAMQLADRGLADLPIEAARSYRQRLRETVVRVIQIHSVEEEMRYDQPYFVVEAGRPVQVLLINEDLMGHNLVITTPGDLQEVAELGLLAGPAGDDQGRQYVPKSDKVLFATNLVGPGQEERLTFNAPTEPGEYPYVCTFPRHWMRMYGVMLVVDDLDAWLQSPKVPKDPLGIERGFVQNWKVEDFANQDVALPEDSIASASKEKGAAHFVEATCSQCHQANGSGGQVGPALNGVLERWKGDHANVLREILEPSHRIDPKYAVHLIVTVDGESISGIVASEDKKSVSVLANPESKELTVVAKDDIEEMVRTSTSMMPKGLLDRYSREEVLELLSYVSSLKATSVDEGTR